MTSKELREDEQGKYQAILATEMLLLKYAGVTKTKLCANPRQLAWIQEVDGEQKLFWATLSRYQTGVWRLCSNLKLYAPKSFWSKNTGRLLPLFKWSFLPYEYNPVIAARLLWTMACAGDDVMVIDLDARWPIFSECEPVSYAWSIKGKEFEAEVRQKKEEAKRLREERKTARCIEAG